MAVSIRNVACRQIDLADLNTLINMLPKVDRIGGDQFYLPVLEALETIGLWKLQRVSIGNVEQVGCVDLLIEFPASSKLSALLQKAKINGQFSHFTKLQVIEMQSSNRRETLVSEFSKLLADEDYEPYDQKWAFMF